MAIGKEKLNKNELIGKIYAVCASCPHGKFVDIGFSPGRCVLSCADCNLRKANHRYPREKGEQLPLPMAVGEGRLYTMNMPQLLRRNNSVSDSAPI